MTSPVGGPFGPAKLWSKHLLDLDQFPMMHTLVSEWWRRLFRGYVPDTIGWLRPIPGIRPIFDSEDPP